MIEISLGKLALLALIALIVLGPEKLPGAARTAGALLRRVRSGWDNVRAEVERELEIEEIRRTAREAAGRAEAAQQALKQGLDGAGQPFRETVAEVNAIAAPGPHVGSDDDTAQRQAELPLGEPAKPAIDKTAHDDA